MTIAAVIAVGLLGVIVAFQIGLALGAPWGSAAWGGRHPGVLPTRLRVASAAAAVVAYPLMILLVASAAGWVRIGWLDALGSLPLWILAALLTLGALANFASRSPRERIWGPVALATAVCFGVLALGVGGADASAATSLAAPSPGEVRPDYLADGRPVWVIGHDDGSVDVLSGFDTHRPFHLGKVLWWCETASAFENPEHGARYDEYGVHIGGPALGGLPVYDVQAEGDQLLLNGSAQPPDADAISTGPAEPDREWCTGLDGPVVYHEFDGWPAWDSPSEAVASEPDGWVLLNGELVADGGEVWLCSFSGCSDRALAAGVDAPADPGMEFGPLGGERFIARVQDGALINVTRVLPARSR